MHLRLRQLSVLFALALMAVLLPTAALAASQPQLTGAALAYSNSKGSPGTPNSDIGTLAMAATCGPDDTGAFTSLEATGNAYGTYPGTFSVHNGFGSMTEATVDSMGLNFEIHNLLGAPIATGTLAFDPAGPASYGTCYTQQSPGDVEGTTDTYQIWDAYGWASYSAMVNVGGIPTAESGIASFDVECATLNLGPACDGSETIGISFVGATIPRNASGFDGSAQTAASATAADPIATSVVSPAGGYVFINESSQQPAATDTYIFLGRQVRVNVYTEDYDEAFGTAEAPLRLTFMVDASLLGGIDPQTVTVLRDGLPAPNCPSPASSDLTDPESFCVLSRAVGADGDLTMVIVSLHASTWSVVAPHTLPQYTFAGFSKPVDNPGANATLNVVKAGQAVPLGWRLTDATGAPVLNLSAAQVSVAGFNCGLSSTADLLEEVATGSSGLQNLGNGYYQFNWKSPKSYANSCKALTLSLSVNGRTITHTALFEFKK